MISKIAVVLALVGSAIAMPTTVRPKTGTVAPTEAPVATATPAPADADLNVVLADGSSVSASGDTAVGVAANNDSGAAAGKLDGVGSVLAAAGPGMASGIAAASPTL